MVDRERLMLIKSLGSEFHIAGSASTDERPSLVCGQVDVGKTGKSNSLRSD